MMTNRQDALQLTGDRVWRSYVDDERMKTQS